MPHTPQKSTSHLPSCRPARVVLQHRGTSTKEQGPTTPHTAQPSQLPQWHSGTSCQVKHILSPQLFACLLPFSPPLHSSLFYKYWVGPLCPCQAKTIKLRFASLLRSLTFLVPLFSPLPHLPLTSSAPPASLSTFLSALVFRRHYSHLLRGCELISSKGSIVLPLTSPVGCGIPHFILFSTNTRSSFSHLHIYCPYTAIEYIRWHSLYLLTWISTRRSNNPVRTNASRPQPNPLKLIHEAVCEFIEPLPQRTTHSRFLPFPLPPRRSGTTLSVVVSLTR